MNHTVWSIQHALIMKFIMDRQEKFEYLTMCRIAQEKHVV